MFYNLKENRGFLSMPVIYAITFVSVPQAKTSCAGGRRGGQVPSFTRKKDKDVKKATNVTAFAEGGSFAKSNRSGWDPRNGPGHCGRNRVQRRTR